MIGRKFEFHDGKKGAALALRLVVGQSETAICRVLADGTVEICLEGHPGEPDKVAVDFLARELAIARSRFEIVGSKQDSDYIISILDMEPAEIQDFILGSIK